jgi:hypothetical protein
VRLEVDVPGHTGPVEVALPAGADASGLEPGRQVLLKPVAHGLFVGEKSVFTEYEDASPHAPHNIPAAEPFAARRVV